MADSKGRIVLPGFANAKVIVEAISDTEYRIRKCALRFRRAKSVSRRTRCP